MEERPIKIIQISDTHLLADQQDELLCVKTSESFKTALKLIQEKNHGIDLVLHSGDISQDGSLASYQRLADLLDGLNAPVYCMPGNHDNTNVMREVFPYKHISYERRVLRGNWQIIMLNSQRPGKVEGFLPKSELDFMEECLREYPTHHSIIVFHHHPVPVDCEWLDHLGLTNADEFWQTLSHYPKVKNVLFGHVHQVVETEKQGVNCYSTPSTCIQFKRHKDTFGLEKLPPGFRWLDLYSDGHIQTGIERAKKYVGVFDKNATGY